MHEFYQRPNSLPQLGDSYHFTLSLNPIQDHIRKYKIDVFKYRPITDTSLLNFGTWLSEEQWEDVFAADESNKKAELFKENFFNPKSLICKN